MKFKIKDTKGIEVVELNFQRNLKDKDLPLMLNEFANIYGFWVTTNDDIIIYTAVEKDDSDRIHMLVDEIMEHFLYKNDYFEP